MIKPQWQPKKRSTEKQIVSWSNFIIIHTSTCLANETFKERPFIVSAVMII
jgi:hypothetical protein